MLRALTILTHRQASGKGGSPARLRPVLSPLDDYPIHQIADVMRHVGTSDRNFYDRYYFNCHPSAPDLFLIFGLGQYPNLGTADAFATVHKDGEQVVVRASKELGADRMDTTVGPFHIEVLEGLKRLRFVLEPNEWGLDFDLTFEGSVPATLEERHFMRQNERILIETARLAQTGCWSGTLNLDGTSYDVTPDRWKGTRDRSWGVRPVGEPEPSGIGASKVPGSFFWVYAPLQFDDFSLVTITQEDAEGNRILEQAKRVWTDAKGGGTDYLGRPDIALRFASGTREVVGATMTFANGPTVEVECVLPFALGAGTGYGAEPDWKHGMYQGELVVQGKRYDVRDPVVRASFFSVMDNLARATCDGQTGWGLFEHASFGPHRPSGFDTWEAVAP